MQRWSTSALDVSNALHLLQEQLLLLRESYEVAAFGLSIFGPLQVDASQANYGSILESSEPAWSNVNVPALVRSVSRGPVYFDYDVSAGALAEAVVGAGRGRRSFVYLSVGTGVGGVFFRGKLLPGYAPQLGHMHLPREHDDAAFPGSCRFHGGCLQGLASGKAMAMRWGQPAETLPEEHPAWELESRYLAVACANLVYTFSPEAIILGSSVGCAPGLSARVNQMLPLRLNGFLEPELRSFSTGRPAVIAAGLASNSSLLGAAVLARDQVGLPFN